MYQATRITLHTASAIAVLFRSFINQWDLFGCSFGPRGSERGVGGEGKRGIWGRGKGGSRREDGGEVLVGEGREEEGEGKAEGRCRRGEGT